MLDLKHDLSAHIFDNGIGHVIVHHIHHPSCCRIDQDQDANFRAIRG